MAIERRIKQFERDWAERRRTEDPGRRQKKPSQNRLKVTYNRKNKQK